MTQSQQLAEKINTHLLNDGTVQFATAYTAMLLTRKHFGIVVASSRPTDSGVYVKSGKRSIYWLPQTISFIGEAA
jgi:hypothetical protein